MAERNLEPRAAAGPSDERAAVAGTVARALAEAGGSGPIVVHADLLHAGRILRGRVTRDRLLAAHFDLLREVADGRPLWMPTFNYGFTRSGRFDVAADASEVGVLSEAFRNGAARWRTPVPVFSFCGAGPPPALELPARCDPFDERSTFAAMVARDATLLFYGAGFDASTIKHHAERIAGGPPYRYDKEFAGTVVRVDGSRRRTTLRYHVRPHGRALAYDAPRLLADAVAAGVAATGSTGAGGAAGATLRAAAASADRLVGFWSQRLRDEPLYMLDAASRSWVEPALDALGRRFEIGDFEPVARGGTAHA